MAYLDASVMEQVQTAMQPWVLCSLKEWFQDPDLMASFEKRANVGHMDEADAAVMLIHALWERLKKTHRLRLVG